MTSTLILYANAGHGHRKVAEAIREALESKKSSELKCELHDALDFTPKTFKFFYPRLYFAIVKWAPSLWAAFYYLTANKCLYGAIRPLREIWNGIQSRKLAGYLCARNFDCILVTHFFAAEVASRLKRQGKIKSTIITVVTDTIPHWVWVNRGTDVYWVLADESRKALLAMGISESQIKAQGIPVSRQFVSPPDPSKVKKELGLDQNRITLLFTSGSFGLGPTQMILKSLEPFQAKIQAIVVCGTNAKLKEELGHKSYGFKVQVLGFVNNMPELMSASDLIIAKPGGATMCEALVSNLLMLLTNGIPGQEDGNERYLIAHGAAIKLKHFSEAQAVIKRFIEHPSELTEMKNKIKQIAKPEAAAKLADFVNFACHSEGKARRI